ncbi:MAG: hypothetical protein K9J74_03605 [Sulfuritalea sp.]|nr:hypothetical protein [Sulfuritalea sp.]
MWQRLLLRLLVALSVIASFGGLLWMTFSPPPGMKATRDGVPYFTPPVINPISGETVPVETLVRHYKGEK